jgi:hypothetical protein
MAETLTVPVKKHRIMREFHSLEVIRSEIRSTKASRPVRDFISSTKHTRNFFLAKRRTVL